SRSARGGSANRSPRGCARGDRRGANAEPTDGKTDDRRQGLEGWWRWCARPGILGQVQGLIAPAIGGWDDPEAYLAGDRRRALAAGLPMPDRVRGSALFADLSGFTPLTEAMHAEYGSTRGAEQLTATLGVVFDAVLGELHRYGGSVVYFSG